MMRLNETLLHLAKKDKDIVSHDIPLTNHEIAVLIYVIEKYLKEVDALESRTKTNQIVKLSSYVILRKLSTILRCYLPVCGKKLL
jgi:hypothetical protein